jgi:hypothetical protein
VSALLTGEVFFVQKQFDFVIFTPHQSPNGDSFPSRGSLSFILQQPLFLHKKPRSFDRGLIFLNN